MITGVTVEPLNFLKVIEKGISDSTLTDTWGHVVLPQVWCFKGNYVKPVHSRNISFKKFEILPLSVDINTDEIYDAYVDINEDMLLDMNVYNSLIKKTTC